MTPSVLIIGCGMAGLSAGCYARMNGFDTEIVEMHSIPGGLCTAWSRKGYTFDLCIHWLCGSKPGTSLYKVYEKLGLMKDRHFSYSESWATIRDEHGNEIRLYTDPGRLYDELIRISPEDSRFIARLCKDIRKISRMEPPVDLSIMDIIRYIPVMGLMKRYKPAVQDVLSEVKSPVLRNLLAAGLGWESQSMFFPLMGLAMQWGENAGYPEGGSLPFAEAIEKRYLELGGTIRYKSKVVSIITEKNRATGVRLSDGTELNADYVISCADGHTTIFDWLKGEYCDDTIQGYYQNLEPFPPIVFISFGLNTDLAHIPKDLIVLPDKPVKIAGMEQGIIRFLNHVHDPSHYPKGKGVITTWIPTDYSFWEQFTYQSEAYRSEKELAGKMIFDLLCQQYPELSGSCEVMDVATPLTFVRYTGNWKGSYEGWQVTPDSFFLDLPQTLPGLSRFYMAGQWVVTGGGIPGAVLSGRKAVKLMCRDIGKKFVG